LNLNKVNSWRNFKLRFKN